MSVTWSALLPGLLSGCGSLGCAAGAIWGRRLPPVVRALLLALLALPLAAVAFLLITLGFGQWGH